MGRHAAGESFLAGLIRHSESTEFWTQVDEPRHAQPLAELISSLGGSQDLKVVTPDVLAALQSPGALFVPGPDIGTHSWHRATAAGSAAWSITGITHTTSSAAAMDSLASLLTSPVQTWDALICTSNAVKENVRKVLEAQANYLAERLGATRIVLPELPVIPLGVNTKDFSVSKGAKQHARAELGLHDNEIVVLYMGRLSFHGKAHPVAMYQSLTAAATKAAVKVTLVECGWHANEAIKDAFTHAANLIAPNLKVVQLDGRDKSNRYRAYASADIFCSFSDNIQETFGITPIEAMSAGLPVVVSDWDGYRDTVRDGVDGFRIDTTMPRVGLGKDLAFRHAVNLDSYDRYCGYTSSMVSIDLAQATEAFTKLFSSAALRAQMGANGQSRATSDYDWSRIIPEYENLWAELAKIRVATLAAGENPTYGETWPARLDPFEAFSHYASHALSEDTILALTDADLATAISRYRKYTGLSMVNYAAEILPTESDACAVLTTASLGPRPAIDLISQTQPDRHAKTLRALTWFVKLGLLRVVS